MKNWCQEYSYGAEEWKKADCEAYLRSFSLSYLWLHRSRNLTAPLVDKRGKIKDGEVPSYLY